VLMAFLRPIFMRSEARGLLTIIFFFWAFFLLASSCQGSASVKIGALLDLSGPLSVQGTAAYKAIRYAVEDINLQGGIMGRPIEIIVFDTMSDPTKLLEGASRLEAEGVMAFLGPTAPKNCLILRRYAENHHIPLVLIAGSSPILTFSGIKTKWTFSVTLNFASELKALFSLFQKRGYESIGVLVQTGDFYRELFLWIRGYAPEYGLSISCAEGFNLNREDISRKLSWLNRCDPDVGLIWANSKAKEPVFETLDRVDLPLGLAHTLFPQDMAYDANATAKLVFVAIPRVLAPAGLKKNLSFVARNFLARFDKDFPSMTFGSKLCAVQAWDGICVIAHAMRSFKVNGRRSLRNALESGVRAYYGVTGTFHFDKRDHSGLDPSSLLLLRFFGNHWSWVR